MKSIITGINGFAGSFLAELLVSKGETVCGTVQPGTTTENIDHIKDSLSLMTCDILDSDKIKDIFRREMPDLIFHLAGASSVKGSIDDPLAAFSVNVNGSVNVLEAVKKFSHNSRTLIVSSCEIYGKNAVFTAADENTQFSPENPYAVSKAAVDMLARVYALSSDVDTVIARPGNHIGPRQSDVFFVPTVAKQIAMIINGEKQSRIELGNIDVRRDFTDVRDIAKAYSLLLEKGERGQAYNICSGKSYLLRDIVNELISISGRQIQFVQNAPKIRPLDVEDMKAINTKMIKQVGWRPLIEIRQTLEDTLCYWLRKTQNI